MEYLLDMLSACAGHAREKYFELGGALPLTILNSGVAAYRTGHCAVIVYAKSST